MNGEKRNRSTLIVQLYRKMRLIRQLTDRRVQLQGDAVWGQWRLGNNLVVLKAADLLKEYRSNPWYIALVPDNPTTVGDFYANILWPSIPQLNLCDWTEDNVKKWGYLTWPQVNVQCQADVPTWKRSTATFGWNEDLIYTASGERNMANELTVAVGELYRSPVGLAYVVTARAGEANCRIVAATTPGAHFPTTSKVAKAVLQETSESALIDLTDLRPRKDSIYVWNPTGEYNPKPPTVIPTPPQRVKVLVPGWKTSKVCQVDGAEHEHGDAFYVFTHHLCRS
jgi:hypothetical protein